MAASPLRGGKIRSVSPDHNIFQSLAAVAARIGWSSARNKKASGHSIKRPVSRPNRKA